MKDIIITVLDKYSDELEYARSIGFDQHLKLDNYKEIYDDLSWHVVAIIDNSIISTIRITPFPNSPIHDWTNNKIRLPLDKNVVNVTKGFTIPEYRNTGIFKIIFSTVLDFSKKRGFDFAIGGYIPSVESRKFTNRLGFEEIDQLLEVGVPPYTKDELIPIICDLKKNEQKYKAEYLKAKLQTETNGLSVTKKNCE